MFVGAGWVWQLPPLGSFLDPVHGVWSMARTMEPADSLVGVIPELDAPVRVLIDDRGVPHIFATSIGDATRALGYVVARDRLFQLDVQTRATAGRISELVGPVALAADRPQRGLGLAAGAELTWARLDAMSTEARTLRAYAEGVTAWQRAMTPADLPLEYRLLGVEPEFWRPENSLYLVARMGYTLTFTPQEFRKEAIAARVGRAAADALVPVNAPIQEPIVPNGADGPVWSGDRLPPPGPPDTSDLRRIASNSDLTDSPGVDGATWLPGLGVPDPAQGLGSNNWAVAPAKSTTGAPILAGDPHLQLTLPSIWYEVHLVVPGQLDVYGSTIPGAPGVVIGFNRDVAWSFTNTGADVLDSYREEVDSSIRPTSYRLDGEWRPLDQRIEEYRGPDGELLAVDTFRATHRGPLVNAGDGTFRSLRWTVTEANEGFGAFINAQTATSVADWLDVTAAAEAPAQNGLVADRHGSIAIRSTGRFPIRPGDGRGDWTFDGTTSESDWVGNISVADYPTAVDPERGFLSSANQQPIDPHMSPPYLGANWLAPWRAMRINQLLRATPRFSPSDFQAMQVDPGSARADFFVPALLAAARRSLDDDEHVGAGSTARRDSLLSDATRLLDAWDRRYTRESTGAVLFEAIMTRLARLLWDELEGAPTPGAAIAAALLADSTSEWWDDRRTPERENRDAILVRSMREGLEQARRQHGPETGDSWRLDRAHSANIYHLLQIPSLSALDLPVQGGPSTISPSSGSGTAGASWRMVVALGDDVRAWTVYPGGQSGNPLSQMYRDRIDKWLAGDLDPVLYPATPEELPANRVMTVIELRGER